MSDQPKQPVGSIGWVDLTVEHAPEVRDFYKGVVGFSTVDIDMGGYSDFCMVPPESERAVAGVCHARGSNADLPPAWLVYFVVADLDESIARCSELGGQVITEPRSAGDGRFCVVRDPGGAVAGLYEYAKSE